MPLYGGDPIGSAALTEQGTYAVPSTTGQVLGASVREGFAAAPFLRSMRAAGGFAAETGIVGADEFGRPIQVEPEPAMEPDAANAEFGIPGSLKFDKPIPRSVAQDLYEHKREQILRQDIIDRREGGILTGGAARFVAEMAGGIPDPFNLATGFIPVVSQARQAALIASAAGAAERAATRFAIGGAQGALGMAALQPLEFALSRREQDDYTMADALRSIALGTVLGGGLHAGIGALGDRAAMRNPISRMLEESGPEVRQGLLRNALANMVDGRPVNLEPILDIADALRSREIARMTVREGGREIDQALPGAFTDPLVLARRGELTAERAAQIRDDLQTLTTAEIARAKAQIGEQVDPKMWAVIADNLQKAEGSRTGAAAVIADQLGYLGTSGQIRTASEREAAAVIGRAMQAEAARGGDVVSLIDDAMKARHGEGAVPAEAEAQKQQLLDMHAAGTEALAARTPLVGGSIETDLAASFVAAGMPEAEARAYGQWWQRVAERRAQAFRGLRGTAEDMYREAKPEIVRGTTGGELAPGELGQAPNETKGHPEGDAEDAAWRRLEPEKTAAGKFVGAPDWVTNGRRLGQLRRLIRQLIEEGAPGRFWYEDSARRIAQITRGNLPEAEKLIGLVAIYSPQTGVFTNMGFAIKAFEQWKRGEPINVKTGSQDARAQAWLDRGEDWGGRKTNSFYLNLMHDIITEHPEALPQLNLPPDVLTEIRRATVDLWVLRALGYRVDAAGGEMAGGRTKYAFSEREIQRAAGMLNQDLPEGARRWLPHQVQAALWSAIKARYEIPEIKQATIAESMRRGFSRMVRGEDGVERWKAPDKNGPEKQGHMEIWRKHALKAPVEEVARMVETARGSFGDAIDRIAQNVTGEAVPSASLGHAINNASPEARRQFTNEALKLLIDDDGNDTLAAHLGVNLNFNHLGAGLFEGNINPTVVTTLVPEKPAGFFDATKARQYARAWQYIFRQDAVPIFRADAAHKFEKDYSVKNATGRTIQTFDTQEAAQAYADRFIAKGETRTVAGGKLAHGVKLTFSEDLDEPALRRLADALMEELGPTAGFTKIGDRDVAFINYRNADGIPEVSDARFAEAIARIRDREDLGVSGAVRFGAEGEYGPVHNWSEEPDGGALSAGIPGRPDLQSWLADRAAAFRGLLDEWTDPESRLAAAVAERDRIATGEPGALTRADAEPAAAAGDGGAEGGATGGRSLQQAQRSAEEAAAGYPKLRGLPDAPMEVGGDFYIPGPFGRAKEAALSYMRRAGLIYDPPRDYVTVDRARATRIAELFEQMEHAPDDPRVRASYEALAKETLDQWQAIKETGLVVEWIKPGQVDPYADNPRLAIMDVIDNNHWWGFPTDLGYGTGDTTARAGNPMLQLTDEVVDGRRLLVNDVFRIVHDYFGHIKEGVGFRASGEENAWRQHAAMYSELARGAMTSETRGQNSWVNFGPHGEANRTAKGGDTIYAAQKVGLLPEWVWNEGRLDATTGELEQAGRAKVRLATDDTRALMTLFEDADATSAGHESWHIFTNELFDDALHPDAPPELIADAAALKRAVGAEEGVPLTREQQEMLAGWGEQYLREGRAPVPELQSLFDRFRAWFISVYETIAGLGTPISDEVRGIYDRMIALEGRPPEPRGPLKTPVPDNRPFERAPAAGEAGGPRASDTVAEINAQADELERLQRSTAGERPPSAETTAEMQAATEGAAEAEARASALEQAAVCIMRG